MHRLVLVLVLVVAAVSAACTPASQTKPTAASGAAPSSDWSAFTERAIEDYFVAHPAFAAIQGRHEFDGKFPDWTSAGIKAE